MIESLNVSINNSTLVVVFGGNGEYIGGSEEGCVVALLSTDSLSVIETCLVDSVDVASGLLLASDGGVVVNCCSSVHVVRFNELVSE